MEYALTSMFKNDLNAASVQKQVNDIVLGFCKENNLKVSSQWNWSIETHDNYMNENTFCTLVLLSVLRISTQEEIMHIDDFILENKAQWKALFARLEPLYLSLED